LKAKKLELLESFTLLVKCSNEVTTVKKVALAMFAAVNLKFAPHTTSVLYNGDDTCTDVRILLTFINADLNLNKPEIKLLPCYEKLVKNQIIDENEIAICEEIKCLKYAYDYGQKTFGNTTNGNILIYKCIRIILSYKF
jgi:hypothetical protein